MSTSKHPAWNNLLAWLQSHGMDASSASLHVEARSVEAGGGYGMFALNDVLPSTPLFKIPASALLNSITLTPHYPEAKPRLSGVQIVSLHLLLHRPRDGVSGDPLFGPYIAILPTNFDEHPLTWHRKRRWGQGSWLLERLPPFVKRDVERIAKAFGSDWKRIQSYLKNRPEVLQSATNPNVHNILSNPESVENDFLWAWLNVNTRCIFYRVKETKSDPDNLTLCPILDFANHSSVLPSMIPRASAADIWDMSLKKRGEPFALTSPSNVTTKAGDELYLRYGFHTNQFLFAEYGFVNPVTEQGVLSGEEQANVDITPAIEEWFTNRGEMGEWMRERLIEERYWGEWTLHSAPAPAHPSFRLMTALRLYHAVPSGVMAPEDVHDLEGVLRRWRSTVNGVQETLSEENEGQWRATLQQICQKVVDTAVREAESLTNQPTDDGLAEFMLDSVASLWREEMYVAKAVVVSLQTGIAF